MDDRHQRIPRFHRPGILSFFGYLLGILVLLWALSSSELSLRSSLEGLPHAWDLIKEIWPPDFTRGNAYFTAALQTFQVAVSGTFVAILISFCLALLAAKNVTPHPLFAWGVRLSLGFIRAVPELVWAVFFVATVGIGAFAGFLAIMVDAIGFCGRFFAEAFEDADRQTQEGLIAVGCPRWLTVLAAIIPDSFPALVNTMTYTLDRAIRASVVIGLVSAGGIGIELKVAMDMFQYQESSALILIIFGMVFTIEQISVWIRYKVS